MEVGRLAAVSKQLKALKAEQLKKGQQLFSLRGEEKEQANHINGAKAQARNLAHKLHKLDENVGSPPQTLQRGFPMGKCGLPLRCLTRALSSLATRQNLAGL